MSASALPRLRRRFATALLLLAALGTDASAQSSPVVDVLLRARMALNDLRYSDADSLVEFVTSVFASRMSTEQRVEALSIAAAARYPEPIVGAPQFRERALDALRELIRIDPDLRLRDDIRWPGLDSLFTEARATTFVARLPNPRDLELAAGDSGIAMEGMSTRPARWHTELVPLNGGPPVFSAAVDAATSPALRIRVALRDGRSTIPTGAYTFRVTALDLASLDSATWSFRTIVDAPTIELLPVPPALDSAQLKLELEPPARRRGIILGLALGAVTAGGVKALSGSGELGAEGKADANIFAVGGLMAIVASASGFLDKGTPLPANVAFNARLRSEHEVAVRLVVAENARLLSAFRATIDFEEQP